MPAGQQDIQEDLSLNPDGSEASGSDGEGRDASLLEPELQESTSAAQAHDSSGSGSETTSTPQKKSRATRAKESMADLKMRIKAFLKVSPLHSTLDMFNDRLILGWQAKK